MAKCPCTPKWHTLQNEVLILVQANKGPTCIAGSAVEASERLVAGLQGWLLEAGEEVLEAYTGKPACAHSTGVAAPLLQMVLKAVSRAYQEAQLPASELAAVTCHPGCCRQAVQPSWMAQIASHQGPQLKQQAG